MVRRDLNFDDVLDDLGQFGWYQVMNFFLVSIPIMFNAMHNAQYIFAASNASYRCSVPECDTTPPEWDTGEWGEWALPAGLRRRCERWTSQVEGRCSPENFDNSTAIACTEWIFENNNSIVAEFGLACHEWKRTIVGSVHNVGVILALPLTGYVSDRYGRRIALVTTAVSSGVMGLVRSFSTSYGMYLTFEFLDAALGAGSCHACFILMLEMVGLDKRVLCGNLVWSAFSIGQALVAVAAWAVPYWRTLTRVIYTPSLFFIVYHYLLDESIRWLLYKSKKDEALKYIYKMAAFNNKELTLKTTKNLMEDSEVDVLISIKKVESEIKHRSLVMKVLQSRVILIRMALCSFWWMCVTFVYYGLSINSMALVGRTYVVYILTTLVEIPGNIISVLTLDRFGRKSSIMVGLFVCGATLIISAVVHNETVVVSLTLLGMLCTSMVFSSIYIYTLELFPMEGRSMLVGFCSMFGRIGAIFAPQTPLLMNVVPWLPYVVFGVLSVIAGALMTLTPETLHVQIPDTIEQAEVMAAAPRTRSHSDLTLT